MAAVGAFTFACGADYLHTNPYDPAVPVTVTLVGPDSLFSLAEVATYTAQTSPVFADTAVSFATSDTIRFTPSGPGNFESSAPPLWPATQQVAVFAYLGLTDTTIQRTINGIPMTIQTKVPRHTGSKYVILTQRVTKLSLRCPDTHACDTLAVGGAWSVWADGFDAHGLRVYGFFSATTNPATGPAFVAFLSRDTTVASVAPVGIRVANVTARKTGATWIVASRDTLRDSLRVVVR
jgi:hypothetical protein